MNKKHLGGHANKTHIDRGALELAKRLDIKTILDIGCGPGGMIIEAIKMGFDSEGIDGFPGKNKCEDADITIHDFTTGKFDHQKKFDLAWSCEFVEHVYEEFVPNFMNSFQQCKFVFMTFAPPNTPGHHHVNCRTQDYWINVFQDYGFEWKKDLTEDLRESSTMKRDFVRSCGLVFENVQ